MLADRRLSSTILPAVLMIGSYLLAACGGDSREVDAANVAEAKEALAPFKQELQAALRSGLEDGPENAIRVCRDLAPEIAARLSTERIRLGRSSDRVRNPDNAPEAWMEPYLAAYAAEGADLSPRSARLDGSTVVYVEPIVMQPLCLNCHGSEVAAAVEEPLRALYPEDRARGYAVGDFRGIFWVKVSDRKS